jgi:hypothetical protein
VQSRNKINQATSSDYQKYEGISSMFEGYENIDKKQYAEEKTSNVIPNSESTSSKYQEYEGISSMFEKYDREYESMKENNKYEGISSMFEDYENIDEEEQYAEETTSISSGFPSSEPSIEENHDIVNHILECYHNNDLVGIRDIPD